MRGSREQGEVDVVSAGDRREHDRRASRHREDGRIELRILGNVEVVRDGVSQTLGTGKAGLLLALLAVNRRHAVDESTLIEGLWPNRPESWTTDSARSAFRTHLGKVRTVMGRHRIVTNGRSHQLDPETVAVDADRAEAAIGLARATAGTNSAAAVTAFGDALGIWRGLAFGGLRGEEALAAEIRVLDELRENAEEDHLAARLTLGASSALIADLRRAVDERPWKEARTRMLMAALASRGDKVEALRAYQDLYRYLADEFGVSPGADVVALEQAIVLDATIGPLAVDPGAAVHLPPVVEAAAAHFVGRDSVLRQLGPHAGPIVRVVGEAGAGKTAVAATLTGRLAESGMRVAFGWAQRDDDQPLAALARAIPGLRSLSSAAPQVVVEAILGWSGLRPGGTVLVLDDEQWIDALGRDVLDLLLHTADERRPIVRTFARAGEALGAMARTIVLPPLSPAEVRTVLRSYTGVVPDAASVEFVERVTAGSALLVAALASHLAVHGRATEMTAANVASSLSGIVELLFQDFRPRDRAVFAALAVSGEPAALPRLAALTGVPAPRIEDLLVRAVHAGITVAPRGLEFRHDLLRIHARSFLDAQALCALHSALAADETLPVWRRARHRLELAHDDDWTATVREAVAAANAAISAREAGSAGGLLEAVIEKLPQFAPLDPAGRFAVFDAASLSHDLCGDVVLAARRRTEAFEIAAGAGLGEQAAESLLRGRGSGRSILADDAQLSMLRRSLALLGSSPEPAPAPEVEVRLRAELAYSAMFHIGSDRSELRRDLRHIAGALDRVRDPLTRAMAHRALYMASVLPGVDEHGAGAFHARGMLLESAHIDHLDMQATAFEYGIQHELIHGRVTAARRLLDAHEGFAGASARPVDLWAREGMRATFAELAGDFERSRHHAAEAFDVGRRYSCGDADLAWAVHLVATLWAQRRHPTAAERAAMAPIEPCPQLLFASMAGELRPDSGLLAALVDASIDVDVTIANLPTLCMLVQVAWNCGATQHAPGLLRSLQPFAEAHPWVVIGHLPVGTFGPLSRYIGLASSLAGSTAAADAALGRARDECAAANAPAWQAHAALDHAMVLEIAGHAERAGLASGQAEALRMRLRGRSRPPSRL